MWNQFHRGEGASATRGGFRRVGVAPVNRIPDAVNAFVAEIRISERLARDLHYGDIGKTRSLGCSFATVSCRR